MGTVVGQWLAEDTNRGRYRVYKVGRHWMVVSYDLTLHEAAFSFSRAWEYLHDHTAGAAS